MQRGKGMGAAYANSDPRKAQQDVDNHLKARDATGQPSSSSATNQVITPHTPGHGAAPTPFQHLNAAMLLDPRRGRAKPKTLAASESTPGFARNSPQLQPGSRQSAPVFTFTSPSEPMSFDDEQQPHQGMMIERMHNVEERFDTPNKRLKRSTSPSSSETSKKSHRSSSRRTGGGSMAQHLRSEQQRIAQDAGSTASMVDLSTAQAAPIDLTTDDVVQGLGQGTENIDLTAEPTDGEQSFYMINGSKIYFDSNDAEEKEVCYGRLENTRISAFLVPDPNKPISARPEWPAVKINLERDMTSVGRFKAIDPAGIWFGNLDTRTAYALKNLLASPVYRLRCEARLDVRSKDPFEAVGQPTSKMLLVTINLYGPRKFAVNPVGKELSQKSVWLRQPKWVPLGKEVLNPHCTDPQQARQAKKAGVLQTAGVSTTGVKYRTAEQEQTEITSLFENLQKAQDLPQLEPDANVVRELLPHQKQALGWMIKREDPRRYDDDTSGTMWRREILPNGAIAYNNVVTGHQCKDPPQDALGGLLADMMGLGKTLQLLSLLSYTKGKAIEFEQKAPQVKSPDGVRLQNIKTTLLLCPMTVISNWEDQINSHIRDGTMSYYVFHGGNRNKDPNFLSKFDVILTTYPTVKSEFFPTTRSTQATDYSPLACLNFFRVVLDEAHFIRNQSTQQYKACLKLNGTRRWCLTATPIQNRLEDMGSLVSFLRVSPFDNPGMFAQYIMSPFRVGDPEAVKRLRILVDTITLRRMKDKINLVSRRDVTVRLSFSESEQNLYDFFARNASERVDDIANAAAKTQNQKLGGKGYINILQLILCLRQIAAHGKELLRDEDVRLLEGHNMIHAIDVEAEEARPVLEPSQAYNMFDLLRETNQCICASCSHPVSTTGRESDEDDPVIGTMLPCYQLICNACTRELKKRTDRAQGRGQERMACPFCGIAWRIHLFDITLGGIARAEQLKEDIKAEPRRAKVMARYDGPHTKTTALIGNLVQSMGETQNLQAKNPKEKPIKSVVFSQWTTHLELIGIALNNVGIQYVTLNGSLNRKQRRDALSEFSESKTVNVLLVTIGTGGVGLNLTAASRVYLMDIGFNPQAEAQAIDRVHRLGQTREVVFTRFLMAETIEEKILGLQKKKEQLADISLKRGAIDKTEAARRRLEDLKELFK